MLVHSVVDGINQRTGGEPSVVVNISAKPEHQVEFGAEQMAQGELVNEWCRQVFYPDSVTDRCEIDLSILYLFCMVCIETIFLSFYRSHGRRNRYNPQHVPSVTQ